MRTYSLFGALAALAVLTAPVAQTPDVQKLNHIIVVYQENWSFDSLYGKFPVPMDWTTPLRRHPR
jgi:phospholipase C